MHSLQICPYLEQRQIWLPRGRHIQAQFDAQTIVVYQAYRASIAEYAIRYQALGADFSFRRMSWIKPNFLWMMHRSGWGRKPDQERILAIRIRRDGFDMILRQAVHSAFQPDVYADPASWRQALASSEVRLQWDPDHAPTGEPEERRVIQLGLQGTTLQRYAHEWIVSIEDISPFVHTQHTNAIPQRWAFLQIPHEVVYAVSDKDLARRLQIDAVV